MEEPGPEAPREDVSTGVSSGGAAAGADDASLVGRSREPQSSPPHKSRRVGDKNNKNRGDDGRGRRPRKGDAKRERKKKALADSALQCQYYQDDHGLRRVRPYTYNFETHAKERWLGRTVIDVFSAEFGANPRSYYESVIRGGLLTVNGNKISPDYILQNSDLVRNRTHRHEPPVAGGDISIVSESPDEIAVDKPCTVPIHPCGSYRFNTLFYILQKQRPDLTLRVCHRLDRLTSGLTILAKTAERAGVIQTQIGSGKTRKTYLARVRGDFGLKLPAGSRQEGSPNTAEAGTDAPLLSGGVTSSDEGGSAASTAMGTDSTTLPVSSASGELSKEPDKAGELWWRYEPPGKGVVQDPARRDSGVVAAENPDEEAVENSTAGSSTMDGKGCPSRGDSCGEVGGVTVRVNCPISVVDPKDGVYGCIPGGKEAQTVVRKVAYDVASDTSVVECTPVHGRTHQIRLHLQWAGHPIANDPCYGGELYFGDAEAKLRAEANSSTEGWKGTSRSKAAAAAAAAAAATAAEAAAAMAAAAAAIPIGGPDSESSELVKINGGETRTTVGVDAAAPIVDKATEGKGGGGGEGAGQDEGGGPEGSASGASRDKPSTEAEEMVAGGEDIEVQRDGEDDEAYMARTCHLCRGGERFTETQLHCHGIWLHALRYQGPDWVFETKMPSWATF